VDREEIVKFWKSFAYGSGSRNFLKDFSTLRDRPYFDDLAYISGESDRIFMKILSNNYVSLVDNFRWSGATFDLVSRPLIG